MSGYISPTPQWRCRRRAVSSWETLEMGRWDVSARRRKPNSPENIGCWACLESHSCAGRETAGLY
jgi:hypothetical protein